VPSPFAQTNLGVDFDFRIVDGPGIATASIRLAFLMA
jgi:hypothetical protein